MKDDEKEWCVIYESCRGTMSERLKKRPVQHSLFVRGGTKIEALAAAWEHLAREDKVVPRTGVRHHNNGSYGPLTLDESKEFFALGVPSLEAGEFCFVSIEPVNILSGSAKVVNG